VLVAAPPPVGADGVPWVVPPGVVVRGVVAPVAGVVAAPLLDPGAAGVVATGGTAVVGVVVSDGAAAVVTVRVTGAGAGPESPASFTNAAASTPSASAATTASATIGPFQRGAAASLVRAAAPQ
jgi:hypothetical protein